LIPTFKKLDSILNKLKSASKDKHQIKFNLSPYRILISNLQAKP